jgi:hypothetical protein
MKKLLTLAFTVLFSTVLFAQEKKEKKTPATAKNYKHECYMMKEKNLIHCMGTKSETQKEPVTFKNGTVLSPNGDLVFKNKKKSTLGDQCISATGEISNCDKMHADLPAAQPKPQPLQPDVPKLN